MSLTLDARLPHEFLARMRGQLFGEVKINFASETLPLDRFVDEAKRTLLERRARPGQATQPAAKPAAVPEPAAQAPAATPPPPQNTPPKA